MKLLELHIDGFGKFHDRTISFHNGINVIYGKNEAGKSTLHTFIRGMLFGIERGRGRAAKNDTYSKFEPWENSGTYEGWLRLEKDGTVYRIERRFRKDDKSLRVINETKGVEEEPTKAFMEQLLGGLNETAYNNTISIGQLKSHGRKHGRGVKKLHCQHEHHREHGLKHHQGHLVPPLPEAYPGGRACAGRLCGIYGSVSGNPFRGRGNFFAGV